MSSIINTYRDFYILSYSSFTFWSSSRVWLLGLIPFFFLKKEGIWSTAPGRPQLPLIYFVCAGSSLLRAVFLCLWWGGPLWLRASAYCGGLSHCGAWPLGCASSGVSVGSVGVAHGLGCPAACGVFLDQGLNPCPLCWQVDFLNYRTTREVQA